MTYNNVQETQQPAQARPVSKKRSPSGIIMLLAVVALLGAGGAYMYFFNNSSTTPNKASVTNASTTSAAAVAEAAEKTKNILEKLGDLMIIPQEEPVVYVVDDAKALIAQQAFFTGAEDGDTLIIFPQNAKAVIYSEKRDKIVNVGPINYANLEGAAKVPADGATGIPAAQ